MRKLHKETLLRDSIISVIVVIQNNEDIIDIILKETKKTLDKLSINYEILIVGNNSEDDTIGKISKLQRVISNMRVLILSKHYGEEIAYTAGLDNCIGDFAILLNIHSDPAKIIPMLIDQMLKNYDIIIGKPKKSFMKYDLLTELFLRLAKKLSKHEFDFQNDISIGLNRKALNSIIRTRRKSRNFSYINSLIGFKKNIIEYLPLKRDSRGTKQKSFVEIIPVITDIIISNSFRPIRILAFLGVAASIFFLLYVLFILLIMIFIDKRIAPQGWISISTVVGFMFFLLFSLLALISEYIIRILDESRNEPFYFIAEELGQADVAFKKRKLNII